MEVKEIHFGCKKILKNLFRQKRIGGKHIPESICLKWIKHLPKYDHKQAIKDWELCKKESLILTKPKPSDLHVFLNPEKLEKIKYLIKNEEGNENGR